MKKIVLIFVLVFSIFANDMTWIDVKPTEALKMKKFGYDRTTKTLVVIMETDTLVFVNVHRQKFRELKNATNKDQEFYKLRNLLQNLHYEFRFQTNPLYLKGKPELYRAQPL